MQHFAHNTYCGQEAHPQGNIATSIILRFLCSEPPRLAAGNVRSFETRDKRKTVTQDK